MLIVKGHKMSNSKKKKKLTRLNFPGTWNLIIGDFQHSLIKILYRLAKQLRINNLRETKNKRLKKNSVEHQKIGRDKALSNVIKIEPSYHYISQIYAEFTHAER